MAGYEDIKNPRQLTDAEIMDIRLAVIIIGGLFQTAGVFIYTQTPYTLLAPQYFFVGLFIQYRAKMYHPERIAIRVGGEWFG